VAQIQRGQSNQNYQFTESLSSGSKMYLNAFGQT